MTILAHIRKTYSRFSLDDDAQDHAGEAGPWALFQHWLDEAVHSPDVSEPTAMTLATVGSDLRPSTRIVLLKGVEPEGAGLKWYSNYQSRKGRELEGNPFAALQLHWVALERVVRIEGLVARLPEADSDAYFASRPLDSRIGAWASPQSQVISGRAVLAARVAKFAAQFALQPPRPPHWGGYGLQPQRWEFWQGRPSRLHDRICFVQQAGGEGGTGGWLKQRLAP